METLACFTSHSSQCVCTRPSFYASPSHRLRAAIQSCATACYRRSAASQVSALASAIGGAHPAGLAVRVAAARSEHLRMGEHWGG